MSRDIIGLPGTVVRRRAQECTPYHRGAAHRAGWFKAEGRPRLDPRSGRVASRACNQRCSPTQIPEQPSVSSGSQRRYVVASGDAWRERCRVNSAIRSVAGTQPAAHLGRVIILEITELASAISSMRAYPNMPPRRPAGAEDVFWATVATNRPRLPALRRLADATDQLGFWGG